MKKPTTRSNKSPRSPSTLAEVKKQERARRRLASVHAIPDMSAVVEEPAEPVESLEEKLAKQKAIDDAALDAADRMKKENEEFLRKLRGGDGDGSVDSQGRELSETVVDTINGSKLFKFER